MYISIYLNAIKFSKPDASPIVSISSQLKLVNGETYAQITVEDNGIGFEQEYADKIFEIFQRLHGRSQYKGTGIGLAICKKIIEKHNASIEVRSEPGVGSCFILTFKQ